MPASSYPGSGDAPDDLGAQPVAPAGQDLAAMVRRRWDEGGRALMVPRKDYWINLAFYLGEQWLWWDDTRNMVDRLPMAWSPLGPGRAHLVINRIRPNMNILLGRMLRAKLAFEVPPSAGSDGVMLGARTAQKVLEAYHRDQDWESIRHDELAASFYGGTSAVMLEWDGTRGTELQYDAQTDQVTGTGDAYLRALNVNEFVLEPGVRKGDEARWAIVGIATQVEAAKEQYRLSWMPRPDTGAIRTPVHLQMLAASGKPGGNDQCLVLSLYERPHPGCRQGRYAIIINDRVVYSGSWPFPFKELNVHAFRQGRIDGKWFGTTFLNDAIKLQFAYNHARSVLQEHLKTIGNMRIVAPRGSFTEDDFTDQAGDILWFQPDNSGAVPQYMAPPNLARWVSAEPENLRAELDEIMHIGDVSRGKGFDRASGQALALLGEKDETPLGVMAHEQSAQWGKIGSQVLKLLEAKGGEKRRVTIPLVKGIAESMEFTGEMLRGQTTATVPLDAVMAKPAAAREAFWRDLWDRKIITDPRRYARGVGLPPEDFEELLDPDAARAHRENYRMMQGIVEIPEDFDAHDIHMAEHNRFRKSDEYKFAGKDARSIIDDHIKFHEKLIHQEMADQVQRAQQNPILPTIPQANEPPGAYRAPTASEQQMQMLMSAASGGGQGGGGMNIPAGGTTPALASGVPEQL